MQTEPNRTVHCKSHPNSSESSAVFCGFGLDWFGWRFFYWVGSVLNTPSRGGVCIHLYISLLSLWAVNLFPNLPLFHVNSLLHLEKIWVRELVLDQHLNSSLHIGKGNLHPLFSWDPRTFWRSNQRVLHTLSHSAINTSIVLNTSSCIMYNAVMHNILVCPLQ